ncbi:MAG: hypothetical protein KAS32_18800 [Candidatus Peribacteraceae bacterium]|nr:hypothetical protein [Candidatus Peribacteraceae bacterium]
MDVATISMPKKEAEKAYKEYLAIVKTRKEEYVEDLKKVYHALKEGKKVIDIYDAFKKTGVNEEGDPKLAIAMADKKEVWFFKEDGGAGIFSKDKWRDEYVVDVRLPGDTFPRWKMIKSPHAYMKGERVIKRQKITTKIPIVPAHLMPKGNLGNYYILWEVDEWKEEDVPVAAKDPFLLKRINANTFIVFAAWDLTEVEQIVMKGQ